jgi:hypothetical protein
MQLSVDICLDQVAKAATGDNTSRSLYVRKRFSYGVIPTHPDDSHRLGEHVRLAPFMKNARCILGEFKWLSQHLEMKVLSNG